MAVNQAQLDALVKIGQKAELLAQLKGSFASLLHSVTDQIKHRDQLALDITRMEQEITDDYLAVKNL